MSAADSGSAPPPEEKREMTEERKVQLRDKAAAARRCELREVHKTTQAEEDEKVIQAYHATKAGTLWLRKAQKPSDRRLLSASRAPTHVERDRGYGRKGLTPSWPSCR
jgi:hypothetical protein